MSESTSKQLKNTAKNTAIYAVGTSIRRITGFVMLPIYTQYLTPEDYGVVSLLTMVIEIAGVLIGLRISQALFRYYILSETEDEKKKIVSSVLISVFVVSTVGMAIIYFFSGALASIIFGTIKYQYELQLFSSTLMLNALIAVGLSYIRARQKPVIFVSIGVISLVLQVVLNIIFVVVLEMHVRGVIYSAIISSFIIAITLVTYVLSRVGVCYSRIVVIKLYKFITPLMFAALGAIYVSYADKYFLRVYSGLTDVGLYTLAVRVCSVLAVAAEAFNLSWGVDRYEVAKMHNAREIYNYFFRLFSVVLVTISAGIVLFADNLFFAMTEPAFYPAASIVPILTMAAIIRIYTVYCNFGLLYKEKTKHMAEASWLKAVIATIGFVALIPAIGIIGAATAIMLANLFEFMWVNKLAIRYYDMELKWQPVVLMYLTGVSFLFCGSFISGVGLVDFILKLVIYMGLIAFLYFMPIWKDDERELLKASLNKAINYRTKS